MRTLVVAIILASVTAHAEPAQLAKDRVEAAAKVYAGLLASTKSGRATVEQTAAWSVRWAQAIADQPASADALGKALADHVTRMKELEAFVVKAYEAGILSAPDVSIAGYFRIEAELWKGRGKLR